jgi:serine protease Do
MTRIRVSVSGRTVLASRGPADAFNDLCLLSVDGMNAKPVVMARIEPRPGQVAYAIGNPRGLTLTISSGIVSGVRHEPGNPSMVQTSAPITNGSSGGGLFDDHAQLIGITTSGIASGNLGFAAPVAPIFRLLQSDTSAAPKTAPGLAQPSALEALQDSGKIALLDQANGANSPKPESNDTERACVT